MQDIVDVLETQKFKAAGCDWALVLCVFVFFDVKRFLMNATSGCAGTPGMSRHKVAFGLVCVFLVLITVCHLSSLSRH